MDTHVKTATEILEMVFGDLKKKKFSIRLWDGTTLGATKGKSPVFTLVLNHPGSIRNMFLPANELTLGEAYIYGDYDIEGDEQALLRLSDELVHNDLSLPQKASLALKILSLPETDKTKRKKLTVDLDGEKH